MKRIPWCVILAMINDPVERKKAGSSGGIIESEDEELKFLGLK